MEKVYITGHRNPDLDSVCSAYAYAVLKNLIDPKYNYAAVRCGHLPESVKSILTALEITPPPYMRSVQTKVEDVMHSVTRRLQTDMPLTDVAKTYKASDPSAIPVYEGETYRGLLTIDDITSWFMSELNEKGQINRIPVVGEVMGEQGSPIQKTDIFEEGRTALSESKLRGLAVLDGEEVVGYVTRRCFLTKPIYKVILVDHNEAGQSIRGIDTAQLMEIIDHHRLDSLKTTLPIFIDAEPVGSTCTIVYQQFLRHGIIPDRQTAKVMLTGIIADTLILRSPTTTQVDVVSAGALAKIIDVEVAEFGREMFSHTKGLAKREPEEAIKADFKKYTENGVKLGIGQCEVTTLVDIEDYRQRYTEALEDFRSRNGLDWALLMITDVLAEQSVLLTTDFRAVKHLPYQPLTAGMMDMPGVMSRKKQLLPEVFHAVTV